MKAVILAAGVGSRLKKHIGSGTSKTMVQYGDRPLLHRTVDMLRERGVDEIVIVVNYMKDQIMGHFGDGSGFGVKINYAHQENPKGGTADAVRQAEGKINDDKFVVIYGDNVFHPNIVDAVLSKSKDFHGVLSCKRVDNPKEFGVLETEGPHVKRITEKSENPPSNLALAGIFVLPNEIFQAIRKTKLSSRGEYELTDSIQILIDEGKKIGFIEVDKFWIDPASKEDLEKAQQLVK
jgi:bifunctional UDP-N-acetylglucosamine pyrophosphorylase/glucosamine-1-phosphate N-acetyltransferase